MRKILINAYLDFVNNYLTIEKYADHNGLSIDEANVFMSVAKHVFNNPHPES